MNTSFICAFVCSIALVAANAETVARQWSNSELSKWSPGHLKNLSVASGELKFQTDGGDSMLVSEPFAAFKTPPWQEIELVMKSDVGGRGEFYWTGTTQTKFGGFSPTKRTPFDVVAGEWQTYRIRPFWQAEKKIIRLRLDFPEQPAGSYVIKSLRVVEQGSPEVVSLPASNLTFNEANEWRARVAVRAEEGSFVCVRMSATSGQTGVISFAGESINGLHAVNFLLRADGRMHTYNVDVGANSSWRGKIIGLSLKVPAGAKVEQLCVSAEPQGAADLEITFLGLHDPITRSGKPVRLEARVINYGGEPAKDLKPELELKGAKFVSDEPLPAKIEFGLAETIAWTIQSEKPGKATATVTLNGGATRTADLEFLKPMRLGKASYVPKPKPAKTEYNVGAYYYPGWQTASRWMPIKSYPERQPLLGWYREGDPEVVDWQIKWAVEHGVNFFLYDWYWDRGARHLEHGIHDALFNARYQNMIKFCLLYANHNPKGSHSPEDFEKIAHYWIDNYFKRPNYLKIDGKPVVVMFSSMNPARDMGEAAVKPTFEKMREICRQAGLPGLYLVACIGPNTSLLEKLKGMGYDAVTAYNWPSLNMTPAELAARRATFATCAEGYVKAWNDILKADVLKLIPPVCAGWDARPWHGESTLVRTERTPAAFKKHLQDCKQLLDKQEQKPKLKMMFVEAWNELGEGSYIEPHREFGFGYLEAIRQVFAPRSAKPAEIMPADVGLGPYDIPEEPLVTAWDFSKAANPLGWSGSVENLRVADGALQFRTRGHDPILSSPRLRARAAELPFLVLKIKASRDIDGQLFWSTMTSPASESSSVHFPIKGDGQVHEIRVRLADSPRWRGVITSLRFDPGGFDGVDASLVSLSLADK